MKTYYPLEDGRAEDSSFCLLVFLKIFYHYNLNMMGLQQNLFLECIFVIELRDFMNFKDPFSQWNCVGCALC